MLRIVLVKLLLATVLFTRVSEANAQTDTLAAYRGFLTACTQYQTTPLQATVRYKASSNLVLQPSDTISTNGYFYIDTDKAYISFGDIEQLITDSVSMMVNHRVEQVMASTDITQARLQLSRYLGTITSDSSVVNLSKAFAIEQNGSSSSMAYPQYHLVSRMNVSGTSIPRQEITLLYDSITHEPKGVETLQRTLIPIDPADSVAFKAQYQGTGALHSVQGIGLCFVRDYKSSYEYVQILHTSASSVPIQISDYLRKNEEGEYELVPAKSGYRLNVD